MKNVKLKSRGKLWIIEHLDPLAYNEPGKEPNVVIKEKYVRSFGKKIDVAPLSINLYKFSVK